MMNVQEAQNCVQSVRLIRGADLGGQSAYLTYASEFPITSVSLTSGLPSDTLLDGSWLADRWIVVL